MAVSTVQHNYTFNYVSVGNNIYTITWYDNSTTVVCSAQYTIVADTTEDLMKAIMLDALSLRSSNARLFKENEIERDENMEVLNG